MTPNAALFESEDSVSTPRLFALRVQPQMVTPTPDRLVFPGSGGFAPDAARPLGAPLPGPVSWPGMSPLPSSALESRHSSTAGATLVPLQGNRVVQPMVPSQSGAAANEALAPIWDSIPAEARPVYGGVDSVPAFAADRPTRPLSVVLRTLRIGIVPVAVAAAVTVAVAPANGVVLPMVAVAGMAGALSMVLAGLERRRFVA